MTMEYPTIVIQFKATNGNMPPDMEMTPMDIAMFLGQGIAMITQGEQVNADIAFGFCTTEDSRELQERLDCSNVRQE